MLCISCHSKKNLGSYMTVLVYMQLFILPYSFNVKYASKSTFFVSTVFSSYIIFTR